MSTSHDAPTGTGTSGAVHSAVASALGLLALAVSLIAMAMALADDLGAGGTAALLGADLVLVAVMGVLISALRTRPAGGDGSVGGRARRARDEERLDELEPLGPSGGPADAGR
ncbi:MULTISPECIES: hypothetical protein [unclassified Streptomyces]|uniref:hypothetical protein n=1 Tax=unclassified Streptomyces TaxID=2593676 RepID=UPI000DC76348|nr:MULTISPECIES: hypothetical protein [unclassified Streptomyces]AWZ05059.1 hypothetical protein DRB89_10800 [Streptomyces sp. ICC4]AWZ12468.1 hypothetical protein DRB96_09185 [Streptomyces sp. ICC1]